MLLADAINLSQVGLSRAKVQVDRKLDQMRQVIHEKTAPRPKSDTRAPKSARPKPTAKPKNRKPRRPGAAT
jgi:hypothetical protein